MKLFLQEFSSSTSRNRRVVPVDTDVNADTDYSKLTEVQRDNIYSICNSFVDDFREMLYVDKRYTEYLFVNVCFYLDKNDNIKFYSEGEDGEYYVLPHGLREKVEQELSKYCDFELISDDKYELVYHLYNA